MGVGALGLGHRNYIAVPRRPLIQNSEVGTSVTFPSVTLRAQSPVELDPFFLVSNQPPGTQFVAIWGATATNVTGRVVEEFDLVVGDAPNFAVLIERLNRSR